MEGIVFDIQKFALHDGPGIRTVIFLKGCSLKCTWCCNPESKLLNQQIGFIPGKCINCGHCADVCPLNALSKGDLHAMLDFDKCNSCGQCISVCPSGALKMFGYKSTPERLIEEVIKDARYFMNSGGGLTLSGGEALVQIDFALEILKLAKQRGLHTCIETAGNIPRSSFEKVFPYVDLFLFDYKITDPVLHQMYTGVCNNLILSNLEFLAGKNAHVSLRCPIVPGINDTSEHFEGIKNISKRFQNLESIELMPYHEFGGDKYVQIGKKPFHIENSKITKAQKEEWRNQLEKMGCNNIL